MDSCGYMWYEYIEGRQWVSGTLPSWLWPALRLFFFLVFVVDQSHFLRCPSANTRENVWAEVDFHWERKSKKELAVKKKKPKWSVNGATELKERVIVSGPPTMDCENPGKTSLTAEQSSRVRRTRLTFNQKFERPRKARLVSPLRDGRDLCADSLKVKGTFLWSHCGGACRVKISPQRKMHQLPVVVQLKMIYIHLEGFHFSAPLETRIKKYIYLKVLLGRTGGNLMGARRATICPKAVSSLSVTGWEPKQQFTFRRPLRPHRHRGRWNAFWERQQSILVLSEMSQQRRSEKSNWKCVPVNFMDTA